MCFRYSSTPLQYENVISSSFSIPHDHIDSYNASILFWVYITILFLSVIFLSESTILNNLLYFGWWSSCTSVMDWNSVLVNFCLPQFHYSVHHASSISSVWYIRHVISDINCQWKWYSLLWFLLLIVSYWEHNLNIELIYKNAADQVIVIN